MASQLEPYCHQCKHPFMGGARRYLVGNNKKVCGLRCVRLFYGLPADPPDRSSRPHFQFKRTKRLAAAVVGLMGSIRPQPRPNSTLGPRPHIQQG
jgi:hypothetical protein